MSLAVLELALWTHRSACLFLQCTTSRSVPPLLVGVSRENTCRSSDWSIKPKNAVLTLPLHNALHFLWTLHLLHIPRLINNEECSNIPPAKSGAQRHLELVFLENGSRGRARVISVMAKREVSVCTRTPRASGLSCCPLFNIF